MTPRDAALACRAMVQRHHGEAREERAFHLARGQRGAIEALAASLKVAWAKRAVEEIDVVIEKLPSEAP